MRNIIAHARSLSRESHQNVNTGYVLLAMTQKGRSARLLHGFGVSESRVRALLRGGKEPDRIMKSLPTRSQEVMRSFLPGEASQTSKPSELHLLLALLKARDSLAYTMLEELKVDLKTMRMHTLASLTGADCLQPVAEETPNALPLERYLADRTRQDRSPTVAEHRPAEAPQRARTAGLHVNQLNRMGRAIEQIQRNRNGRPLEDGSALTEEPLSEKIPKKEAPFTLNEKRFPLLSRLGRNLTWEAKAGRLDTIVGREREMEQITDVLSKRRANSPCLIGPSGVGKTALVEGLAVKLSTGEPSDRWVIEIRPADLLAGTSVRGALSERLGQLRQEVALAEGNVVLFFDELHALLATNDGQEALQELKTALGKGEMPCIAATTIEEYTKFIEADSALARRFTKIEVGEPTEAETLQILEGILDDYERHHQVRFDAEALTGAVRLSARYIHDRALPDKAISLIDTAGARVRRRGDGRVTADDVSCIVAEQIGVPADRLSSSHHEHLLNLEETLASRIVGHAHVLAALGETLRRNAAGFRTRRPIGSFLFLGPTGVGKTETAKALGEFLFPTEGAFVRLDMSEFQEAHAVARLIGAPPGYVGHQEGGQLTEAVRRRPYCLVLLDEIEKAHPEVLQILLQVLDDGRLTDGLGRTISFENTIITMTSNLGSNLTVKKRPVGFGVTTSMTSDEDLKSSALAAVRGALPPELWNRIDELLVFEPLTRQNALDIASLLLRKAGSQLERETGVRLKIGEGMLDALADAGGYDPAFGARPMRRTIQRLVEGPLSKLILEGALSSGDAVIGRGSGTNITFESQKPRNIRTAS